MFGHGGGGWTDLPRLPRAVTIISLDFAQFSFRLFVAAHSSMCPISAKHDLELVAGTTIYVSSAYLKMRFAVYLCSFSAKFASSRPIIVCLKQCKQSSSYVLAPTNKSLDVISLYANIPRVEGAKFVSEFYSETLDK